MIIYYNSSLIYTFILVDPYSYICIMHAQPSNLEWVHLYESHKKRAFTDYRIQWCSGSSGWQGSRVTGFLMCSQNLNYKT